MFDQVWYVTLFAARFRAASPSDEFPSTNINHDNRLDWNTHRSNSIDAMQVMLTRVSSSEGCAINGSDFTFVICAGARQRIPRILRPFRDRFLPRRPMPVRRMIISHELTRTPPRRGVRRVLKMTQKNTPTGRLLRTILVQKPRKARSLPQTLSFMFSSFFLFHGGGQISTTRP